MQKKGKFILMPVAEFGAWLTGTNVSRAIGRVQNHHTFIPGYQHFQGNNHFLLLQGMENAHLDRGFSEIAQNLTVFPDGAVAVCRSMDTIPAGIKGANTGGVCIENLGNFDAGGDQMTGAQRDAIVQVSALLCRRFQLAPNDQTLVYHHWYDLNSGLRTDGAGTTKSCPGTAFFGGNTVSAARANFISSIAAALGSAAVALAVAEHPPADRTAVVTATSLKVRRAAAANSKRVKALGKGTPVHVYEEVNGWYRIHPTDSQWVSGKFVALT